MKKASDDSENSNKAVFQSLIVASQFIISIAILIVLGAYFGNYLDTIFKTRPLISLGLSILGFSLGIYLQIRQIQKNN